MSVPARWMNCPRKSQTLIADKFLAFKTPLDSRYLDQLEPQNYFMPSMVFDSMKSYNVKIGLWIDLTKTKRYYDADSEVKAKGCKYRKILCEGHQGAPEVQQVQEFVQTCRTFMQQNPLEIIGVHCTHGFNRTGFLICAYLIEEFDYSPEAALMAFSAARPPGIYKPGYIQELFERYSDEPDANAPAAPERPDWCFEEEEDEVQQEDLFNEAEASTSSTAGSSNGEAPRRRRREKNKQNPTFMPGVPGVTAVTEEPELSDVQTRVQEMCGWRSTGFPGSQPVSMTRDNIRLLREHSYVVSWKADGTRYMMLIDGRGRIYFIDRDNSVFKVSSDVSYWHRKKPDMHLHDTLLDGEMVIDETEHGEKKPHYLAYDVVRFHGEEIGKLAFNIRSLCLKKEFVTAREMHVREGRINRAKEPFGLRQKEFWPVGALMIQKLLGPKFQKSTLGHEPDGLIFQPVNRHYEAGRDDNILKWKPSSHNSIDFKLCIKKIDQPGMLREKVGELYVGGLNVPYSKIKVKRELKDLNNRIIECAFDIEKREWRFMRERTDKSYPNAHSTAQAVMKSILEPVTSEMLINFVAAVEQQKRAQRAQLEQNGHNHNHHHHHHHHHNHRRTLDEDLMPPPPKRPAH